MDTDKKQPTKSAGHVSKSPSRRLTAEEKLKKSLKSLSHTSGGMGGAELDGSSLNIGSSIKSSSKADASRKKVGGVVLDLETIEGATKQKLETRGKRNNVIILVLALALVVSLVFLAISVVAYKNSKKEPNCIYQVEGDADAHWIVQGNRKTKFRLRQGLGPDLVYIVSSAIDIKTQQSVVLTLEIEVLLKGQPISIYGLQDADNHLVRVENTNKYVYQGTITGGGKILLFEGIDFSEAPGNLNSDNVKIIVTASINKV